LAEADLLVLDEATSAVDPATEVRIARALASLTAGRSTLTIAHRLSTAEAADLVVVVDAGHVVEVGHHDDLARAGGVYARMHDAWVSQTRCAAAGRRPAPPHPPGPGPRREGGPGPGRPLARGAAGEAPAGAAPGVWQDARVPDTTTGPTTAPPDRPALDPAVAARLKRADAGLVAAIVQQHDTGEVLMLGWMDDEALRRTLSEGRVTFWSRSRAEYWRKGDTSGHFQHVRSVAIDCDGDALLVRVDQVGRSEEHTS